MMEQIKVYVNHLKFQKRRHEANIQLHNDYKEQKVQFKYKITPISIQKTRAKLKFFKHNEKEGEVDMDMVKAHYKNKPCTDASYLELKDCPEAAVPKCLCDAKMWNHVIAKCFKKQRFLWNHCHR